MQNNKLNGIAKYWREDGVLINAVEYLHGVLHGGWKEYYPSEKIKSETQYKFDKKDGLQIMYYENGNKKNQTSFKDDIQVSETLRWTITGELIE